MVKEWLKRFRDFAMRGNVVDMAVGVVIGASFGKISTSLVNDILMPPIGLVMGRVNFTDLFMALDGKAYPSLDAAKKAGAPIWAYGSFINTIIDFIIVAFAMFLIVQWFEMVMQKLEPPKAPEPPKTRNCPYCISAIAVDARRCPHCTSDLETPQAA